MRPIYLYVHIPKTGGQSARSQLIKRLGPRMCPVGKTGADTEQILSDPAYRDTLDLVIGHGVVRQTADLFQNREPRFVTMLRNPIDQMISLYNWMLDRSKRGKCQEPPPLNRWIIRNRNYQAWWLVRTFSGRTLANPTDDVLFDAALDALKDFWIVGKLDDIDRTLAPFLNALGVKEALRPRRNIAGQDYEKVIRPTAEIESYIRSICEVDFALMDAIKASTPVTDAPVLMPERGHQQRLSLRL